MSKKTILWICGVFAVFYVVDKALFSSIYQSFESVFHLYPLSFFLSYVIVGIPVFLYLYFKTDKDILTPLGLDKSFARGLTLSFLFTSPMFLGYGIVSGFEFSLTWRTFWIGCVFAGFFEELYYRGFFFGELYRKTNLGFLFSILVPAFTFASLHLYQSNDTATLVGIFITTFLGAALFAWLYVEWNFNLWIPIGLHFFMNLSWALFDVSENALGDITANLFRILTIVFAIAGTILYKRKTRTALFVNRKTLWIKR